jgi:NADH:ubiquinone oxidoreductase subunit K
MQTSGMVSGVLFIIGIAAIFTSGGATMMMVIGDACVAGAGIAMVALGSKKSA